MSKPQLLLIPGLNCTAELFAPQLQALANSHAISFGDHQQDNHLPAIATRILAAAPARFALAGLSMGGYICFEILRQAPERVEKLMLLDTNARADNDEQRGIRQRTIEWAASGEFERVHAMQWQRLVHESRREDVALRAVVDRMAADTGPQIYVRQQTAIMNRPDSRPFLPAITCPVAILVGEGDQVTPPKVAQEMHVGIAGSKLIVVPECGHLSTIEAPGAVTAAMKDWLA
jgi:pimeloyl-ACP methyl ester carboxylesterase